MDGIYNRDQINYASMIENMIKNRMDRAKIERDRILNTADIHANTANNIAGTISRGADAYQKHIERKEYEDKYNKWMADKQAKQDELIGYLKSSNLSDKDKADLYTYIMMYGGR